MLNKYIRKDASKRCSLDYGSKLMSKKLLINSKDIPLSLRYKILLETEATLGKNFITCPRNRCVSTFRSRAVYSRWGLGRHAVLKFVNKGYLGGYTKFSK